MEASTSTCPFCILRQPVIKENEFAYALLSHPRKVEGHALVIPKRHVEKPWELSDEEVLSIFDLIRMVQKKIIGTLGSGCDVRQHHRPFLQESRYKVNHVHYHVMPRNFEDALFQTGDSNEHSLFVDLLPEEFERVRKILE